MQKAMDTPEPLCDDTILISVGKLRRFRSQPDQDVSPDEADQLSRDLLKDFCLRHWYGHPQNSAAMEWIVDSIGEVLEHENASNAFCLKPRSKSRPKGTGMDPLPVAAWCALAVKRGYTVEDADAEAAEVFNCAPRTARRHREAVVLNPLLDLESFLARRSEELLRNGRSAIPLPAKKHV
jgi:hypothetical protein